MTQKGHDERTASKQKEYKAETKTRITTKKIIKYDPKQLSRAYASGLQDLMQTGRLPDGITAKM